MEVTCRVDLLTGAAHHHNAPAYEEDTEDEYDEEEDDHEEDCYCEDCLELRAQNADFYDDDDPYGVLQ